MPKQKERRKHIRFYIGIAIFVGFFWVMPQLINVTPSEIVGEGLGHVTDTWQVIKNALKAFTQDSKEVVTGIAGLASIAYALYHAFKKK